jgi:disulfide bond formation protein DsbB
MNLTFPNGASQQWAVVTCIIAGGLLCIALFMEHVMGLAPCPLCMMQRLWVAVVGLVAYISLLHNPRWGIYPLFAALAAVIGAGFSIRQLWLQSLPADQVPACGPPLQFMLDSGFPLADVLVAMTSGTGDCAEISWSLLGISIPGWLLLAFAVLVWTNVAQLRHGSR